LTITKLKLVKRQMYGRGKIDLLEARVVGVSDAWHRQNCVGATIERWLTPGSWC